MIGIPMDFHGDDIDTFIAERDVAAMTHLRGNGDVWADFGINGSSSWVTITVDGRIDKGFNSIPADVLTGEWISGT